MEKESYISLKTFCKRYGIQESFVHSMYEFELVHMDHGQDGAQLPLEELPLLEKMVRLHHELDINPEGIQAIHHLLQQVEDLQKEVVSLRRKLDRLE
ncbi:MerR family transcriptional regulator [Flagellimonas taeanensis]|uniref:MerR HTH family regulatory protein n=2 Tax=Flagellimonas taeanensis TaxID=1005926 RepID=A0A1M6UP76_9FLAO|nr:MULTISPECIES: chaperone modulator CbpM [Allomuricauda]MDC6385848.1 chaperone modulator CbpM [Muricauda sp. SK9]RIV50861.1 MerR family transcriptional regulator [Allomuricauda taeanensis]SFC54309.1 MerR HTH family regulatory protein [Allomuricauda taeanensis]SHK70970.1 MerR HTH family regulatory protein [Allomuricauda taeanensis]